jgi:uncharacterized GH25 family protein
MKPLLLLVLLCSTAVSLAATGRATLHGTILDAKGNPLPGVTVMVYHAGVKTGYSIYCPSCYVDCGKRVLTDAHGNFQINDLAPDLWFTVLAARDGYVPKFTKAIDPAKDPTPTLKLDAAPPPTDFSKVVRGRVLDAHGSPIPDAVITPLGLEVDGNSMYGSFEGLQPIAVTNRQGNFAISFNKATSKMMLTIEGRAFAPKVLVMPSGPERHSVELFEGATITGRLVIDGKPVGNAQIGLIPLHRGLFQNHLKILGDPYDEIRIGTDDKGRFTVTNVPAAVDWLVYAKMASVSGQGATIPIEVKVDRDGQYLTAPDLQLKPGYSLKGTVLLSDQKPIPPGMHVTVSSNTVSDTQTTDLGADGRFGFINLPVGDYEIWASVKGYDEKDPNAQPVPVSVKGDLHGYTITLYPRAR